MNSVEKKKILLVLLLGPLGLFSISNTGGIILTLLAVIMGNSFYIKLGYIPYIWYILFITLSIIWAISAIKNKNKSSYFPYVLQVYKNEDKNYKFLVNIIVGMFQFALVLFIVAMCYKLSI